MLLVDDDVKTFYKLGNGLCTFTLKGTDQGSMTVIKQKVDENGLLKIENEYRDVPLTKDVSYSMDCFSAKETEQFSEENNVPSEILDKLLNIDNQEVFQKEYLPHHFSIENGFLKNNESYAVDLDMSYKEKGRLVASLDAGYEFVKWEIVYGNAEIEDTTSEDTSFVAGDEDTKIEAVLVKTKNTYSVNAAVFCPIVGGVACP